MYGDRGSFMSILQGKGGNISFQVWSPLMAPPFLTPKRVCLSYRGGEGPSGRIHLRSQTPPGSNCVLSIPFLKLLDENHHDPGSAKDLVVQA